MPDAGPRTAQRVNSDRLKELAAGFAAGSLETAEESEFRALVAKASLAAKHEVSAIIDTASLLALSLPRERPSPGLRDRILTQVRQTEATPELFEFVRGDRETGWVPMKVPGAFVKLLSIQPDKGYAVVLGKLTPGTHYPAHTHIGSEQIYVLEGDLHIGDVRLKAGDFHNAKAGSSHGVNFSTGGCTIMAIVATEDLATLIPH